MRFVITGHARSRTAWFSAYLTQGDTICHHEAIATGEDMFNPRFEHVGTADSGYVLMPEWANSLGKHKVVVIHRPVAEVLKSLDAIGLTQKDRSLVETVEERLHRLDGLHIDFYEIDKNIKMIHDYLEIGGYDPYRAALFSKMNVQSQYWRA